MKGMKGLYDRLLAKGILIRRCDDMGGLSDGFYRIAVRSHEDNERLLAAIREVMDEAGTYKA